MQRMCDLEQQNAYNDCKSQEKLFSWSCIYHDLGRSTRELQQEASLSVCSFMYKCIAYFDQYQDYYVFTQSDVDVSHMSSNFSVINITDQKITGSISISMEMAVLVKLLKCICNHNIRYVHCNQKSFPSISSGGFRIKINLATKYVRRLPL